MCGNRRVYRLLYLTPAWMRRTCGEPGAAAQSAAEPRHGVEADERLLHSGLGGRHNRAESFRVAAHERPFLFGKRPFIGSWLITRSWTTHIRNAGPVWSRPADFFDAAPPILIWC
jgi:hypothetical protein